MGTRYKDLTKSGIDFIKQQHIFFVGTAEAEGYVNISPKGMDSFRVVNSKKIIWLNLTGSGNETAAHVLENNRMTIMFCSFEKKTLILRLYGNAEVIHPRDNKWDNLIQSFPEYISARQIIEMEISLVQTSCGFGVPYYELKGERPTLLKWANNKGRSGIEQYWEERNLQSINGKETGIINID